MNRGSIDVLALGRICVDKFLVLDRFPAEDTKVEVVDTMLEAGGNSSTAACCVNLLGAKAAFIGRVGDDEGGRYCLKRLKEYGVDVEHVRIIPGGVTPMSHILVSQERGTRTLLSRKNPLPPIKLKESDHHLIHEAAVILLDPGCTHLAPELARIHQRGVIVYDCEIQQDGLDNMMALADYFIPSADFLLSGKQNGTKDELVSEIHSLDRNLAGRIIVTAGAEGAYYMHEGSLYQVTPPDVPIIDTTGAGDNFHGAIAYAICRGYDIHAAVALSVASATLSCRGFGSKQALPELGQANMVAQTLKSVKLS